MHPAFEESFEKTAILGSLARFGLKAIKGVGGLAAKTVTKANPATGGRSFSPMKAMTTAFGGSYALDTANKAMNKSRAMHGKAINNLGRYQNINSGIGQARIR